MFSVIKQVAAGVAIVGLLVFASHVVGQLRDGHGSAWTLWGGIGLALLGLVFWMIAAIGTRLDRNDDADSS